MKSPDQTRLHNHIQNPAPLTHPFKSMENMPLHKITFSHSQFIYQYNLAVVARKQSLYKIFK